MTAPPIATPLVSTQWLADHLGADRLVIVDATVLPFTQPNGRTAYLSGHESYLMNGHLPGAVFADLIEQFSDPDGPFSFTRPSAARFEDAAGALGIDNETAVVIYDAVLGQWAARLWWLFRTFGYDTVAVLDGGLRRWTAEERELAIGHVERSATRFTAAERPELWATKDDVLAVVNGEASGALVCGIPSAEFTGEAGHRERKGHIPVSVNVPVTRLLDRQTNTFLRPAELGAAFAQVAGADRVIAYCNGGIIAAADALALTLAGHTSVAVYDESLNEWAADATAPLVTTA